MPKKERIIWIDQIKALAFIFVILGHMAIDSTPKSWIYAFHMPLYLFVHGATLNVEKIYNTDFKSFFLKHFQHSVVPFFWLNFIMLFFRTVWHAFILGGKYTIGEHIKGIFVVNGGLVPLPSSELYFVMMLFISDLVFWFIIRLAKKDYVKILGLLTILSTISLMTQGKSMPFRINTIPATMLQIFIGRLLMDVYLEKREKLENMKLPLYIALTVGFGAIGTALWKYNGRYSLAGNKYGKEFVIAVVCAVFLTVSIAMFVMKLPKMNIIVEIGQNTLFYLGTHQFFITVLGRIFKPYKKESWYILITSIVIFFALYPLAKLCKRFCPFILGVPLGEDTKGTIAGKIICIAICVAMPTYWFAGRFLGIGTISMKLTAVVIYVALCVAAYITFEYLPFFYIQKKPRPKTIEY